MRNISRRGLAGLALGGLSSVGMPSRLLAAAQCVTGNVPPFVPQALHVDPASQMNFRLFRQYSDFVGLAGVVCRNTCNGRYGTCSAGTLALFPWLKTNARAPFWSKLNASVPAGSSSFVAAKLIPNPFLPLDEYFCRIVLQAPYQNFIGFTVDKPINPAPPQGQWYSEVPRLADGAPVGIDWTSANLNGPWFGGSRSIPSGETCSGGTWRTLIVDALNQASSKAT